MSEGDNLWKKKLSEKPKDYEKKITKAQITESISEPLQENFTIFNIDNGIFKLKSNNVNFSSNTNPIKPKKQMEHQLYKASIKGHLTTEDKKKIRFDEALVYQDKLTDEMKDQILVIFIGEEPGKYNIMPFFRHRENIRKKCSTKLMEGGWMSFIGETNTVNLAENQQCIHNYFSETDDAESLELFESTLAGTNSILKYLQENVK